MDRKSFVFLYPQVDILNFELKRASRCLDEKAAGDSKAHYKKTLNDCIDVRYRKEGFLIFYALLDKTEMSPVIDLQKGDKVIYVGMDAKTHRTKDASGNYHYPDQDYIINQLGDPNVLRVAGFHMWDCVEKLAKRAHERGISTFVDEDLTEFFTFQIKDKNFKIDKYPTFKPEDSLEGFALEHYWDARKGKPWLWQNY